MASFFSYNNYVIFFCKDEDIAEILQQAYKKTNTAPALNAVNISYSLNSITQLNMMGVNNTDKVVVYDRNHHFILTNVFQAHDIPVFEISQQNESFKFMNIYNSLGFLLYLSIFHPIMQSQYHEITPQDIHRVIQVFRDQFKDFKFYLF